MLQATQRKLVTNPASSRFQRLIRSNTVRSGLPAAFSGFATNPAYDSKFFATKPLFNKILIANRGEIAIRVMRTAKRLGVKTVAVFSEADCDAQFVKMADEAYCIGPAASAESYLRMDKIIDVAKKSGAQAIHPGYGFLSENASFADLVAKSGLSFIGPPAQAIIDMGSKSASKEIMTNAGVPCVPGYHGANQDPNFLKNEADKMGYPVLIKAVKGGGGKGMRIVEREDEFFDMLESSRREATKSFGDDTVLVEKYIVRPRHVEVQVFADTHGNAVYLFERDCSVQRRHQKVLEEAPAPHLSPELRANLGAKAVAAAKAVNYVGAGTVEFIFDTTTSQFYFMEMNTRLQVEHPITEMITNTDLVEWQLIVAAGNKVPRLQKDLAIDGWAFEARIYAENPENNFMPDTGPLRHLSFPAASESVRIETGVQQGDTVSVHYDPMISKLVVKGSDRTEALRVLRKALGEFEVVGLNTNIEFLKKLASHPEFINGDVETGFIKKYYDDLFSPIPPASDTTLAHATLSLFSSSLPAQSTDPWDFVGLTGFRMNSTVGSTKTYQFVDSAGRPSAKTQVAAARDASGMYEVTVETSASTAAPTVFKNVRVLSHNQADGGMIIADIGDKRVKGRVVREGDEKIHVFSDGTKVTLHLAPDAAHVGAGIANTATGSVKTPMPCKISSVHVEAGAIVKKGQNLVVLEAMKMEHVIKSPKDGVVKRVHYKVGEIVGEGKVLISFED
ncbi:Methylcrotonoyl-CoA carboxylase subunit alpha, mitochondrial [Physocladia obscura]|uniref:Methylcrotonoyl-CoA carboxylase subunit alpha, mitochondrial n=1 Tax=Physocladia obscura TaxID=109957 RepID=A0AAD5XDN4_9FUNG|nr:Methylcrotonoyl-CoA carboxylase subunit alpha, mitochondrial [Physocladia obscura]